MSSIRSAKAICLISAGHLLAEGGNRLLSKERDVEICPASGEPRRIEQAALLKAVTKFPGLQLELGEIWAELRNRCNPACAHRHDDPGMQISTPE